MKTKEALTAQKRFYNQNMQNAHYSGYDFSPTQHLRGLISQSPTHRNSLSTPFQHLLQLFDGFPLL